MEIWQLYILGAVVLLQVTPEPIVVQQAANWTSIIMAAIAIIPATITGIISGMALLQTRQNAKVAAQTAAAVISVGEKTDVVSNKATEIHTLTNSNLSKVQAQLEVSQRTIEGLNQAQVESARRMASMEHLIASLVPPKGQPTSSQDNSAKLDQLSAQVTSMQQGTPPIPVVDEAVLAKLDEQSAERAKQAASTAEAIVEKLDTIQESADVAAKKKQKRET